MCVQLKIGIICFLICCQYLQLTMASSAETNQKKVSIPCSYRRIKHFLTGSSSIDKTHLEVVSRLLIWHLFCIVCFFGRITNACRLDDNVASIDYKLGYKQMHYPENGSYKWLDDGPSQLNDDISGVNPSCWKGKGLKVYSTSMHILIIL